MKNKFDNNLSYEIKNIIFFSTYSLLPNDKVRIIDYIYFPTCFIL